MLSQSKVPRALENKTTVFGFEISELIVVFVYLSLTNFIFGRTALKIPIVWGGTVALSTLIILTKRNRPDHFLEHLIEYYQADEIYSAGDPDAFHIPLRSLQNRTRFKKEENNEYS